MLLSRIQFPHDGNLYPAWLLLAWKLLSFYHVEIAFQDASLGLGLQHAWCLLHNGEFLIKQSYYKIIIFKMGFGMSFHFQNAVLFRNVLSLSKCERFCQCCFSFFQKHNRKQKSVHSLRIASMLGVFCTMVNFS